MFQFQSRSQDFEGILLFSILKRSSILCLEFLLPKSPSQKLAARFVAQSPLKPLCLFLFELFLLARSTEKKINHVLLAWWFLEAGLLPQFSIIICHKWIGFNRKFPAIYYIDKSVKNDATNHQSHAGMCAKEEASRKVEFELVNKIVDFFLCLHFKSRHHLCCNHVT